MDVHGLPSKMRAVVLEADWRPRAGYLPSSFEKRTRRTYFGSRVWHKPRLVMKEVELQEVGSKEVLLRIRATGICGSDVHMVQQDKDGYILYPGLTKLPVIQGHELSGEVVYVGHEVNTLKPGDMVTCEEMWWCGECDACRTDNLNQCQNLEEMGFTKNGGFAQYLIINHKYCWKVNELMNRYKSEEEVYEVAAITEPTAVAYNAIFNRAGGFKPGAFVAVWGAGPIGLASLTLAKAAGASKIIVFETSNIRKEMAKSMGADFIFDPQELGRQGIEPYEKILDVTGGSGADFIVEAAGVPEQTLPQINKALAIGAKVAWIGRASVEAPIFIELFQTHAAQLYGSQGHSGYSTFRNVIRLMVSGSIDMRKMVTARISLDDIPYYIERLMRKEEVKVLMKP